MATRLSYPKDKVYESFTDYVEFKFYKYVPPFNRGVTVGQPSISRYNYNTTEFEDAGLDTILMYMPEDIGASYGSSWGSQDFTNVARDILNVAGAAANANAGGLTEDIFKAAGNASKRIPSLIGQGIANLITGLPGQIGGNVDLNSVLSGTSGIIINPNTEIMFQGFKMRSFDVAFKMTPEDKDEAGSIKKIIDTFKTAALPDYGGTSPIFEKLLGSDKLQDVANDPEIKKDGTSNVDNSNYISNPYLCQVNFMKGSSTHPYLPKYKPCVISDISISYTPDGSWATYADGSPVSTAIRITFQESKLVYRSEISKGY